MMISNVTKLANHLESARLLLPSSSGIVLLAFDALHGRTPPASALYRTSQLSLRKDRLTKLRLLKGLPPPAVIPSDLAILVQELLEGSIHKLVESLPSWEEICKVPNGSGAAANLLSQHSQWLDAFCSVIRTAVPHMQQLLQMSPDCRDSSSSAEKSLCLQLWEVIVMHCYVLQVQRDHWPLQNMHSNPALTAALSSLLDFVLEVQQSDPVVQAWAKLAGTKDLWENHVVCIINTSQVCFQLFCKLGSPQPLSSAVLALPRGLIARISLVVGHMLRSELAVSSQPSDGQPPLWDRTAVQVTWNFLSELLRCFNMVDSKEYNSLCTAVMGSAALEAVKLILSACARSDSKLWIQNLGPPEYMVLLLECCLDSSDCYAGIHHSNATSSGRATYTNPAPTCMTTSNELLYALRMCCILHPDCVYTVTTCLQSHLGAQEDHSALQPLGSPSTTTSVMPSQSATQYLRGVFHHLTFHTLLRMERVQAADALRLSVDFFQQKITSTELEVVDMQGELQALLLAATNTVSNPQNSSSSSSGGQAQSQAGNASSHNASSADKKRASKKLQAKHAAVTQKAMSDRKAHLASQQATTQDLLLLQEGLERARMTLGRIEGLHRVALVEASQNPWEGDEFLGLVVHALGQLAKAYPSADASSNITTENFRLFDQRNPGHSYNPGEMVPLLHRMVTQDLLKSYSLTRCQAHEWLASAGRFSVIEACIRGATQRDGNGLRAGFHTLYTLMEAQASLPITPDLIRSCISLVTTFRKLRRLNLDHNCEDDPRVDFNLLEATLQSALASVNSWVLGDGKFPSPRSTHQSVSESLRMQLFAILSLTWVDEQNARVRERFELTGSRVIPTPLFPRCHHKDSCHVHLARVTEQSLMAFDSVQKTLPSVAAQQRQVAKLWDGFGRASFHGRLLPGCSHLGCTSLEGVCEAASPTQLCSGCRRVRYCSSKCQREAWVGGGHGLVCGKGEWAVAQAG